MTIVLKSGKTYQTPLNIIFSEDSISIMWRSERGVEVRDIPLMLVKRIEP